jgi:putative PIN family toxin of toxin-antitoxin system
MSGFAARVPRVVMDTNVVLSALVFTQGRLVALRHAWQARQLIPVASKQTVNELIKVLGYKKFRLSHQEQQSLLADYLPYIEPHVVRDDVHLLPHMPQCRDAKDQMFLDLAQSAHVDWIVSGDEDLLVLDDPLCKHLSFRISTPVNFLTGIASAT